MTDKRPLSELAFDLGLNIVLALIWSAFVYDNVMLLRIGPAKLSIALLVIKGSCDVVFFLIRRFPKSTSISVYSWLVAVFGSMMILFLRGSEDQSESLVGQIIQCTGLVLQLFAIISLNRSFGIVPANRGIKTGGMYKLVRHPLYATYLIGQTGFLISNVTAANLAVFGIGWIFQIARIFEEERFLNQDETYREYAGRVKWRLIPGVF